jgi:hypothetical protein
VSNKDIEQLTGELANLKERNGELFQKHIQPGKKEKIQEFLNAFENYFSERGFVIRKKENSVRAAYDTLHFRAISNDSEDIFIMKGREQIASITINHKGARKTTAFTDPLGALGEIIVQLETEIALEKSLTNDFENPVFYYTGRDFGHLYDSPLSVLESIFNA